MEREYEKTARGPGEIAGHAMYALGSASVVLALVGQAGAASGAPWTWRAFFAIAACLLDIAFTLEWFLLAVGRANGVRRFWAFVLAGASSLLPLLLSSGPFLFAWLSGDLSSNAVRGFYADAGLSGALATATSLRALRLALPLVAYRTPDSSTTAASFLSKPAVAAVFAAGLAAFCLGLAGDACLLPTHARLLSERRAASLQALATLPAERLADASAALPDLFAVSLGDATYARGAHAPADTVYLSVGPAAAWFDAAPLHRARGLCEAALSTLALVAWLGCLAALPHGQARPGPKRRAGKPADRPTGRDELNGLLGRRLP